MCVALTLLTACGLLPGPHPSPTPSPPTAPTSEFAPLAVDALPGLDTGANDFINGFAVAGHAVVAAGTVFGNRLAPTFRYSTDAGATWRRGRLSEAAEEATPPDQGDQTSAAAVATVAGTQRWVVLGTNWRQPLTWTSTDGRIWDRHAPPADQIAENAEVHDIVAVPEGFVLVGTDPLDRPTAWTSADGVSWQPHPMGGEGSPVAVASKGSTVVAVGSRDDTYATWRSNDRGRTWSRGTSPPKPADDGGFSRRLEDVTTTEDGFTAIGSYSGEGWRPVTYTSTNGSSWRISTAEKTLAPTTEAYGSLIRSADGRDAAVSQEYDPEYRPRLWARSGHTWRQSTTPLQTDRSRPADGDWTVSSLTRSGNSWIAAATRSTNGRLVTQLWRSVDEGRSYEVVPHPDALLNEPTVLPAAVVRTGAETLVLGDSRRRPVAWSRSTGEPFGPARLVSDRSSDRVIGAAAGPDGVLAYGSRSANGADSALVWRRDGDRWVASAPGTFSEADNRYASSEIRQIVWLRNRWVAVGSTTVNGDLNASALVATSTDGRRWLRGRAAQTYAKAGGDVWYDVTDLQGDHDRSRAMYAVTAVENRLLAVGESSEGKGRSATVWSSADARTWSMRRLPLDGLAWASMRSVAVRGSSVVVVGTGATGKGEPSRLVVWQSGDGGRTWRHQLLDPTLETDAVSLVALDSGFALVAGTVDRTSRPVLMLSADGRSWRDHPVSAVTQQSTEGAGVAGTLAVGDDLLLLVRTTNRFGAGTRLVVQPTR